MKAAFFLLFTLVLVSACDQGPNSPRGFSLPPGDVARGKATFVQLNCLACHRISNLDRGELAQESDILVPLGGLVSKPISYGDLVTSVINPSHKLSRRVDEELIATKGESNMRNYNDVMTVSQLVDLVTYLESEYQVVEYRPSYYIDYP